MSSKKKPAEPPKGFRVGAHSARTKTVACDWFEVPEGEEPFTITVKRLSFAELDDLPPYNGTKHVDLWPVIAPYVVGWNAIAETSDGAWEAVPPPAEGGPEAFQVIEPEFSSWIFFVLKFGHQGGDELRKKLSPSSTTPGTNDGKS